MGLYGIRANFFRLGDNEAITCIFIDKYLGGVRSAVSLILIIGLEVWWCVLFAGLASARGLSLVAWQWIYLFVASALLSVAKT